MSSRDLQIYAGNPPGDGEFGVVAISYDTGEEIATSYDVAADVNECGELMAGNAI